MGREKLSCWAFSQERKTKEEHNNISLILATLREKGKQVPVNPRGTVWEVKPEHLKYVWSRWGQLFLAGVEKRWENQVGTLWPQTTPMGPDRYTWWKVMRLQRWGYRSWTDPGIGQPLSTILALNKWGAPDVRVCYYGTMLPGDIEILPPEAHDSSVPMLFLNYLVNSRCIIRYQSSD